MTRTRRWKNFLVLTTIWNYVYVGALTYWGIDYGLHGPVWKAVIMIAALLFAWRLIAVRRFHDWLFLKIDIAVDRDLAHGNYNVMHYYDRIPPMRKLVFCFWKSPRAILDEKTFFRSQVRDDAVRS